MHINKYTFPAHMYYSGNGIRRLHLRDLGIGIVVLTTFSCWWTPRSDDCSSLPLSFGCQTQKFQVNLSCRTLDNISRVPLKKQFTMCTYWVAGKVRHRRKVRGEERVWTTRCQKRGTRRYTTGKDEGSKIDKIKTNEKTRAPIFESFTFSWHAYKCQYMKLT